MVEFQIIDVDYILVNEKPIIRIFGKTADGKSVCGFYEGFSPYFYALGNAPEMLNNDPQVVRMEKVERKFTGEYRKAREIYKVTTQNPAKTPELREKVLAGGGKPFEADIPFKYRFMADMGLSGLGWVKAPDANGAGTNTVNVDKKIELKEVRPLKREEDAELKIAAFDIECAPIKAGEVPEARRDPIIMISFVFSSPYKGRKGMVLSTRADENAVSFSSEAEMLEEFITIINEYDPDILTGFNVNNFDIPYILERMKNNSIKPIFGRCRQKHVSSKKLISRFKTFIVGRVVVDSFELVKKDFSLKRYSLDFVSQSLLGENKVNVKHSEIEKLWKGSRDDYKKLVEYSLKDAELAMKLVVKLNLVDKYAALSKMAGTLLQDTIGGGETTRIENFLLREFNREGYVFPSAPSAAEINKREAVKKVELKGGFVIEPVKKLHSNVAVLDFKSMYPSIIIGFNICPTTIIKGDYADKFIETASGARFMTRETRQGIIPRILDDLMKKRQGTKKKLRKAEDPYAKRALYAEQWALKILANAFYGYLGYSRAKIYDLDIANAITASGRDIIQKTKAVIENDFKYEVVYGDTDSVMVKMPADDLDKIKKIADNISSTVTKLLPDVIELEFEKVFKRFLPLTKKRYVAWKFEPKEEGWSESIEMKGVETVRRDWCGLVSETMTGVIEILLKKEDVKDAVKYFKEVVNNLMKNQIPINKLVVTKSMTKLPKNYAGMQPHIELVKKLQVRTPAEVPGIGDRIEYVIVKGTGLVSKRAEDPNYVAEHGLQIDSQYYIENQLLPPLERIFASLGISKSELLGYGKQMGLFDILKNSNGIPHEPTVHKELPATEVHGFICMKCNKSYSRPPLLGVCECGGQLMFSSPRGPVEAILVEN